MTALVIGASSGIGAATCTALARRDIEVVAIDRHHGVDIRDERCYGQALDWHLTMTRPTAIVYAAGYVDPRPLADATLADLRHTLEVNLVGAWRLAQRVAARRWSGALVFVASTAGTRPSPGWAAYAASKAALVNLAETVHAELFPQVRTYVLNVARCATPLRARLAPDEDPATIMQPTEVAEVICSLLDDTTGVLCGAPIKVGRT